jgi:L-histidine Nalpha-methyltransferase
MEILSCTSNEKTDSQREGFAIEVLTGLCSNPKSLSSKYFYDDFGSLIFQKITQHPDYYLTQIEYDILNRIKSELPELLALEEIDIIELGAGDGHKSQLIINGFLNAGCKVNFYPIDISEKAMALLDQTINPHENLTVCGVIAEYFEGLRLVRQKSNNQQLVMFLGSNIGNFDRVQNQGFLRQLWNSLNADDYVLLGFDMKKDIETLTTAYNDSSGYTRDFNINLLKRINEELGGTFETDKFCHLGVYNPVLGAMESYVLSTEKQEVYISELQRSFHFDAFEPIHFEYSFKFTESDIEFLSQQTGFELTENFTDERNYFVDSLWKVVKQDFSKAQ